MKLPALLLLVACVAATAPPLPPLPPKPPVPRLRTPRAVASADTANHAMVAVVASPMVTNGMHLSVGISALKGPNGLIVFDYPTWLTIDRCNHPEVKPQVWTNFFSGPLPSNRIFEWNSIAPSNRPPIYRVILEFRNN